MRSTLTRTVFVLALLWLAAVRSHAQPLVVAFDVTALGYATSAVRVIEADGNPATVELLAIRHSDGAYSVGAIRAVNCAGAWFNPKAGLPVGFFASVAVERVQGIDRLFVRDISGGAIFVVALTVPACQ